MSNKKFVFLKFFLLIIIILIELMTIKRWKGVLHFTPGTLLCHFKIN